MKLELRVDEGSLKVCVTAEIDTLYEALETITAYLRACGFHFDGALTIWDENEALYGLTTSELARREAQRIDEERERIDAELDRKDDAHDQA
jgi:rRNA processing protein Krr1/Pno1